jgi:hypothetical protein
MRHRSRHAERGEVQNVVGRAIRLQELEEIAMNRTDLWTASVFSALCLASDLGQAHGRDGAVVVVSPSVYAQVGGGHRHWRGTGLGLGIGFGVPAYAHPYGLYGAPVLLAPAPIAYGEPWQAPAPMAAPDPVFQPRQGQSATQIEADRQDCNRWAIGQPGAMPDARVFHRATLACMESKGYTVR